MLVTVPATRAFAAPDAAGDAAAYPGTDVLWLFGGSDTEDGYFAQALAPDATQVTRIGGLHHAIGRSADGQYIVDATAVAGGHTQVTVYAAATGLVHKSFTGPFAWPAEPDLLLSVDPSDGSIAVVGTAFASTPTGKTVTKQRPDGTLGQVASLTWAAHQGTEVFDLTGAQLSSVAPQAVPLGTSLELAHTGGKVLLLQHGAQGTSVSSAGSRSVNKASTWTPNGHVHLKHVDPAGRAYLLTQAGDLLIQQRSGTRTTAAIGLHSVTKQTARPYPSTVLSTGPDTVAVVDASRQYLATVDANSGKLVAKRTLRTSTLFTGAADSLGAPAAVDQTRRRIYVLDKSGITGGVWVHDADTLDVLDRWHSDAMFRLVWVAPSTGTVYLQANEGPVAVHDVDGSLVSFVASDIASARAL